MWISSLSDKKCAFGDQRSGSSFSGFRSTPRAEGGRRLEWGSRYLSWFCAVAGTFEIIFGPNQPSGQSRCLFPKKINTLLKSSTKKRDGARGRGGWPNSAPSRLNMVSRKLLLYLCFSVDFGEIHTTSSQINVLYKKTNPNALSFSVCPLLAFVRFFFNQPV